MRTFLTATAALALATGINLATADAAQAATSQVSVVHGIAGQPVDVYVNGTKTLDNFQPGTVAGPLSLEQGSYNLALTKPGEPVGSAILTLDGAAIPGGGNLSIVAHLDASGTPKITAFANDVSKVAAGKARLVVRHTAAAPAVDVRAGGTPVFTDLTNPNEAKADVDAGTVTADVVLAGTSTVAIGPADVTLTEGTSTIVYAYGSAEGKTLALATQVITGLHSAPSGVPSGDGGLADERGSGGWWLPVAAAFLLAGGAWRMARARASK